MSVYKNNRDKWCVDVDFVHPDGRQERIRKTSPVQTRKDAEKYEVELRRSLLEGAYGKRAADSVPTLAKFKVDFMEAYRGERRKASGVRDKECLFNAHLLPLFGNREVTSFDLRDQRKLRDRFAEHKSSSRYNGAVAAMNRLIALYHEESKLPGEPFRFSFLKVVGEARQFYDFEQYDALVAAAKACNITCELACLLGGDAGLRRGEMFALGPEHCDMRNRLINVEVSEVVLKGVRHLSVTKGGDSRAVDMTERLHEALGRYLAVSRKAKRLLLNATGEPYSPDEFREHLMAPIQRAAGLKDDGSVHILRHTFCSHLAIAGVPIMTIKELAGHKNINTTLRYMHLARGEKRRAVDMLESQRQRSGN